MRLAVRLLSGVVIFGIGVTSLAQEIVRVEACRDAQNNLEVKQAIPCGGKIAVDIPNQAWVGTHVDDKIKAFGEAIEGRVATALRKKLTDDQIKALAESVRKDATAVIRADLEAATLRHLESFDRQLKALATRVARIEKQ